jgi:RNA polymerase sigma-70 factor (ECF subfamily)
MMVEIRVATTPRPTASASTVAEMQPVALESLVHGVLDGQEAALEALYEATVGKVYALALAVLRSAADAEEAVCDTYAWVWANAARYDAKRANVLGWLLMLCRSRALTLLRTRKARNRPLLDDVASAASVIDDRAGPEDLLSMVQEHSLVHSALAMLSSERRQLLALAFLQDMTHQQIAAHTGLPLGTVKSHLRRALQQMRLALEAQ